MENKVIIWIPDWSSIWIVKTCPLFECLVFKAWSEHQTKSLLFRHFFSHFTYEDLNTGNSVWYCENFYYSLSDNIKFGYEMNLDFEQQIVTAAREIYIQGENPLPLALVKELFYKLFWITGYFYILSFPTAKPKW